MQSIRLYHIRSKILLNVVTAGGVQLLYIIFLCFDSSNRFTNEMFLQIMYNACNFTDLTRVRRKAIINFGDTSDLPQAYCLLAVKLALFKVGQTVASMKQRYNTAAKESSSDINR